MDWHRLDLLMLAAAFSTVSAGCVVTVGEAVLPRPSLPVDVEIHAAWDDAPISGRGTVYPSERETIRACLAQWNDAVRPCLREGDPPPFAFAGMRADKGFESRARFLDGISVIYKVPEITPEVAALMEAANAPERTVGYGLAGSDALVFTGLFATVIRDPESEAMAGKRVALLLSTACHELGHVLGLAHQELRPGIMNETDAWYQADGRYVQEADAEAFCLVHGCACK